MGPLLGLFEVELGPAEDDIMSEVHENLDHVLQAHGPWTSLHEGDVVDGET